MHEKATPKEMILLDDTDLYLIILPVGQICGRDTKFSLSFFFPHDFVLLWQGVHLGLFHRCGSTEKAMSVAFYSTISRTRILLITQVSPC